MMVSRAISKLPPVGEKLKIVSDGLCQHSLYAPSFDIKLILLETGALVSGSRILSRTALSLKCSLMVRKH